MAEALNVGGAAAKTLRWPVDLVSKTYAAIALEERVSILGHIVLTETALEPGDEFVARAERGRHLLSSLLGDSVGTP